jgi:hypothetical protein
MAEYKLHLKKGTYVEIPDIAEHAYINPASWATIKITFGGNLIDNVADWDRQTFVNTVGAADSNLTTLNFGSAESFPDMGESVGNINGISILQYQVFSAYNPTDGKVLTIKHPRGQSPSNVIQIGSCSGYIAQIEVINPLGADRLYLCNEPSGTQLIEANGTGYHGTIVNIQGDTRELYAGTPPVLAVRGAIGVNGSPLPNVTGLNYQLKNNWDDLTELDSGINAFTDGNGDFVIETAVPEGSYYIQMEKAGEFAIDETASITLE